MNSLRSILYRPVFGFVAAGLVFTSLFSTVATVVSAASTTAGRATNERLITLHDRGQERGILTHATTLREALKDANVSLDQNDLVEPGLDEQLTASNYEANIYRARPVIIIDGNAREKVMSPYQTGEQIAEHAGITLHDEDVTTIDRVDDIVSEGAGLKLTIDRATPFTFVLYGKKVAAYSQAATVGDMLKEKNVKLGVNDTVSVAGSSPLTSGMTVEVWRNGVQTVTQEEEVAMPTRQVQDATKDIGYKEVQTPGKPGKKQVTYEINMQNGQEVSRKEIQTVVTEQPTEQVEIVGTKSVLPAGSHEDWMAAAGIAASDYGYVNYIVSHEGGWEPCKVQGGAIDCTYDGNMGYGVVQATPGRKMASAGSDWRTNPITQLKWATGYATARYGSWSGAYNYWLSHHNW